MQRLYDHETATVQYVFAFQVKNPDRAFTGFTVTHACQQILYGNCAAFM